jgi:hypothetical protein
MTIEEVSFRGHNKAHNL